MNIDYGSVKEKEIDGKMAIKALIYFLQNRTHPVRRSLEMTVAYMR
jgi:hypothetical protein